MENDQASIYLTFTIILQTISVGFTLYLINKEKSMFLTFFMVYISIISIFALYKATITNPGFIEPRKSDKYAKSVIVLGNDVIINTINNCKTFRREIITKNIIFIEEYCSECRIFKNGNISHCFFCFHCVSECDHHCPWIDNCIGKNNFKFFIITIYTSFIILVYNVVHINFLGSIIEFIFGFLHIIFIIVFTILCFYYLFILITGCRSRLYLKGKHKNIKCKPDSCIGFCFGINN